MTFSDSVFAGPKFKSTVNLADPVEIRAALIKLLVPAVNPFSGPSPFGGNAEFKAFTGLDTSQGAK